MLWFSWLCPRYIPYLIVQYPSQNSRCSIIFITSINYTYYFQLFTSFISIYFSMDISNVESIVLYISSWMNANLRTLDPSKTAFIWADPYRLLFKCIIHHSLLIPNQQSQHVLLLATIVSYLTLLLIWQSKCLHCPAPVTTTSWSSSFFAFSGLQYHLSNFCITFALPETMSFST